MKKIEVDKVDEVYLIIKNIDKSTALELREHFSCFIENYFFHPLVKAKQWDGRISFFNWQDQTIPIGLFPQFVKFCKKFGYEYQTNFSRDEVINEISDEEFEEFYGAIFNGEEYTPRDYQDECIKSSLRMKRGVIESPTGCHVKGTKILMYDGSLKNVEDIKVGDILIGPDNTKRNVLKLFNGNEEMYKISPKKGKSFIVNKNHILHLKLTNGEYLRQLKNNNVNISVKEYLSKNKTFKHEAKLVYNNKELIFNNKLQNKTKLSSYFIGMYLGDGSVGQCGITTMDEECVYEIYKQSKLYEGCKIVKKCKLKDKASTYCFTGYQGSYNLIIEDFRKIGLNFGFSSKYEKTTCETKFIPDCIKYGNVLDRLDVLAGLIDSDGYLSNGTFYDITLKSKELIEDISFVARSVGLFVPEIKEKIVNGVTYFRCCILGNIQKIPVKIERKKKFKKRNQNKSIYVHGFDIEELENDDFYGFELDSDHLYMTSDYIIHHNSGKSLVIYSIIRFIMGMAEGKILLIVPNVSLVNQMFSDFQEYGWKQAESYCSLIFSKSNRVNDQCPITISTWQSIYKRGPQFFQKFQAVIVDETHGAKSNSIQACLKKCSNAEYRLGLTGTMPEELINQFTIFGFLGPKIFEMKSSELIEKGVLSKIKIANLMLEYPKETRYSYWHSGDDKIQQNTYQEELDVIYGSVERNKIFHYIINKLNKDQNILILCHRISHLKDIKLYLEENFTEYQIDEIFGEIDADKRENIRKSLDESKRKIYLTNNSFIIVSSNEEVVLTNGQKKKGSKINFEDDIDNNWIKSKKSYKI